MYYIYSEMAGLFMIVEYGQFGADAVTTKNIRTATVEPTAKACEDKIKALGYILQDYFKPIVLEVQFC